MYKGIVTGSFIDLHKYSELMSFPTVINLDECPLCGKSHPNLRLHTERTEVYRDELIVVVATCPIQKEDFKIKLKKKKEIYGRDG